MGGRGSSGGPLVQSLDEYLGLRGLSWPITDYDLDKLRLPHGETLRQRNAREAASAAAQREHQEKRAAARKEYEALIAAGKVRPPTRIESLLKAARGHPDNLSTQAARRALEKRGVDWKSGRKVK